MSIKFVLVANKQGQVRLAKYFSVSNLHENMVERMALEGETVRKCISRHQSQCNFFNYEDYKVVYRRYASLYVVVGMDANENELAIYESIHLFVESLNTYFNGVCELDIMFALDRVYMILDEIFMAGDIIETNKKRILDPVYLLDKYTSDDSKISTGTTLASMINPQNIFSSIP